MVENEDFPPRDSVNQVAYERTAADEVVDLQTCVPILRNLFQDELVRAITKDRSQCVVLAVLAKALPRTVDA